MITGTVAIWTDESEAFFKAFKETSKTFGGTIKKVSLMGDDKMLSIKITLMDTAVFFLLGSYKEMFKQTPSNS